MDTIISVALKTEEKKESDSVQNEAEKNSAEERREEQQQPLDRLHSPASIGAEKLPTTQNTRLRQAVAGKQS